MFSIPTLMVGLYILICILGVLVLIKAFPSRKRIEIKWLLLFTIIICFISFCSLNVYVQDVLQNKIFFSRIRFLGFSLIGQAWFFFLFHTYGKRNFFHHPWAAAVSCAPAVVTWALVLVPGWHEYFSHSYQPFPWHEVTLVTFEKGPWWRFHLVWSHIFVWLGVFYTLFLIPRVDRVKRNQLIMLSFGGFVAITVDLVGITLFKEFHWAMLSSGTTFITAGAILYSITKHGLLELTLIAKDHIFRKIPDPVLILDEKSRLLDFNSAAGDLLKLTPKDQLRPMNEIQHLETINLIDLPQELSLFREDTGHRHFQVMMEALDSETPHRGKILLFREITAQKTMEQKLSNNLEFKARLLSMIAHDFSGVIESQTYLSSVLERGAIGEMKNQAKSLVDSTFASKDFLANVLLWAKSQENKFQPQVQPFEMNVLIKEAINNLESTWRLQDVEVILHSEKDPLLIKGDDVMIESVIRNLLKNAIRASVPGQKIEIFVKMNGTNEIKVLVKDEGVGMSPKYLAAIQKNSREPFSSDPDTRPSGFGVGLAIARRFVDLHNGSLQFQSEEGKGTLVTLTLPV